MKRKNKEENILEPDLKFTKNFGTGSNDRFENTEPEVNKGQYSEKFASDRFEMHDRLIAESDQLSRIGSDIVYNAALNDSAVTAEIESDQISFEKMTKNSPQPEQSSSPKISRNLDNSENFPSSENQENLDRNEKVEYITPSKIEKNSEDEKSKSIEELSSDEMTQEKMPENLEKSSNGEKMKRNQSKSDIQSDEMPEEKHIGYSETVKNQNSESNHNFENFETPPQSPENCEIPENSPKSQSGNERSSRKSSETISRGRGMSADRCSTTGNYADSDCDSNSSELEGFSREKRTEDCRTLWETGRWVELGKVITIKIKQFFTILVICNCRNRLYFYSMTYS